MYNDNTVMPGEDLGETYPRSTGEISPNASSEYGQTARASEWEEVMQDGDVIPFQGEWGYGQSYNSRENPTFLDTQSNDSPTESPSLVNSEGFHQNLAPDQQMAGASRITSYGFDTASRVYGLDTVLSAIYNTDITPDMTSDDPLHKIYEVIEPRPEGRAYLYREIQKDLVTDNEQNNDPSLNTMHEPLGMTPYGEFYDKNLASDNHEQNSIDAIKALKKLLDTLATSPRFQKLRDRAARENKSVIDALVGDTMNPTITTFLNGVGGELSESSVEEVLDEIAEEEIAKGDSDGILSDRPEDELEEMFDGEPKPEKLVQDELDAILDGAQPDGEPASDDSNELLSDDELTDEIINRFNRAATEQGPAVPRPQDNISEFLTDDEFEAILHDEESHLTPASEFDSAEIIERLKRQVPPDFETAQAQERNRHASDFPTDLAA